MKVFAEAWPDEPILQVPLAKFDLVPQLRHSGQDKGYSGTPWYAHAAIEYGWSRNILVMQIERGPLPIGSY